MFFVLGLIGIEMSPILLEFPERPDVYFLFTLMGAGAGALVFFISQSAEQVPTSLRGDVGRLYYFSLLVSAVVGAFLPGLLEMPFTGQFVFGKSLMSALFFGCLSAELLKSQMGIRQPTGEVFALSLPLSLAISRLGCLFGHCCLGLPGTGPVLLVTEGVARFPVPLVESFFHFSCFLLLFSSRKISALSGLRFRSYVASYCVFRFCTEFFRPHPQIFAGLTLFQWMSVLLLLCLSAVVLREKQRGGAPEALRPNIVPIS